MKLIDSQFITRISHADYAELTLRGLNTSDGPALADYFAQMSTQTRSFFGPHPMDANHAHLLCRTVESTTDFSRVVLVDKANRILGYFILQWKIDPREVLRYSGYQINLMNQPSVSFAPSIAEELINKGIGSQVFMALKQLAQQAGMQSMILMGGVQARNHLGVHFYRKLGFQTVGGYYNEVENIDMLLPLDTQSV